jgi:hypothetical protein
MLKKGVIGEFNIVWAFISSFKEDIILDGGGCNGDMILKTGVI